MEHKVNFVEIRSHIRQH